MEILLRKEILMLKKEKDKLIKLKPGKFLNLWMRNKNYERTHKNLINQTYLMVQICLVVRMCLVKVTYKWLKTKSKKYSRIR